MKQPIITLQHRIHDGFDTIYADLKNSADGYQEFYVTPYCIDCPVHPHFYAVDGRDGSAGAGAVINTTSGNTGNKFNPETFQQGLDTVTQIVSLFANRQRNETKQQVKAVCGRKPLFRGIRKDAYYRCAQQVNQPKPEVYRHNPDEHKISIGGWVAIGIGSAVAVTLIAFGISKVSKNKITIKNFQNEK